MWALIVPQRRESVANQSWIAAIAGENAFPVKVLIEVKEIVVATKVKWVFDDR
jgi:hypothetical protein